MHQGRLKQFLHELGKRWRLRAASRGRKEVLFLAGFQRSGTNMVMKSFDLHSRTQVFHEGDPRSHDNFSLRSDDLLAALIERSFAPHVVIKSILDSDRTLELEAAFPGARFIWPIRQYHDVINSHLVRWPDEREAIDLIATDRPERTWRSRNIAPETRAVVKEHYRPGLSNVDCKALMYFIRHDYIFKKGLDAADFVKFVCYEDLVADPAPSFEALCAFAGVDYEDAMSRHIHRKSVSKSEKPDISPAIDELCERVWLESRALCDGH